MFFAAIAAFGAATLILPKKDFSELENKYLAKAPSLSIRSAVSGELSDGISEYLKDHFALRTGWISLRTGLERLLGHEKINGVYISEGRLFQAVEPYDYENIDRNIEALNKFGKSAGGRMTLMLAPTSSQIYADLLPDYSPEPEERRMISYVYSKLDPSVQYVDLFDTMMKNRGDYIYYRTDHHWTTGGAYLAYSELIRSYGYDPVGLDRIDIEHASHGFLGSYYTKVLSDSAEPDTIDIYTSGGAKVTEVVISEPDGTQSVHDGLYFRENLEKRDKYLTFLGENVPMIEIESEASGGSVLVIKDSFANCFVPFLTKHFSKVTVIDLRYMMDLRDYADPESFDRILLLYNAATFSEDRNIAKLSAAME